MRPYLAVITDSFREAMASRVLYIVLVLITAVLLLAIAPLGIPERVAWRLREESVEDWPSFVASIRAQADAEAATPGKQIWSLLPEEFRQRLGHAERSGGDEASLAVSPRELVEELNKILANRELYDAHAWHDVKLGKEASGVVERGAASLSDDQASRRNRLLLDAAFPKDVTPVGKVELRLSYFGMSLWDPLPFDKSQLPMILKTTLTAVMNFFMGTLAVLAAILVTAPIIPHTFEAGAIDLLLSKPVSRPLLFLAKFLGGCAFILINVAYFIGGLWLLAGIRFYLWHAKLLLCIPLFMFLFAIYYGVSAFAGVIWRNAIVSVVVTVLFWAACFLVGTAKGVIDALFLAPKQIVKLVRAGDSLIAANEAANVLEWRESAREWAPIFTSSGSDGEGLPFGVTLPVVGPVYDAKDDRLLALRPAWPPSRFGMTQSPLSFANRGDGWKRLDGPPAPRETAHIFVAPDGQVILVGRTGIFRVAGELIAKKDKAKSAASPLGLPLPASGGDSPFVAIGPDSSIWWTSKSSAAMSSAGTLAVWDGSALILLERDDSGRFNRAREASLEPENIGALVAFEAQTIVLALADGRIRVLDARDLNELYEFRPEGKNQPRSAAASSDGRWFAVLFHTRKLWLLDASAGQPARFHLGGQGEISAATFSGSRLLVAHGGTHVTEYELDPFAARSHRDPPRSTLDRVYHYFVLPVYTVFPKPGELGQVVSYLLTDQETVATGRNADELAAAQIKLNIGPPIWSSLAFLAVVLSVTCLYIRQTDF